MTTALVLFAISLVIRAGNPLDRTVPFVLLVIGYLVISVGAAVGGDLVYLIGTHVNRHAWRGAGHEVDRARPGRPAGHPRGRADEGEGRHQHAHPRPDAATRSSPSTRRAPMPAGRWPRARSSTAASSARGTARGSASTNGHVARGPAMYDQPAYEVRRAESGTGWEVRRAAALT